MTWFRLDTNFHEHPKILAVGPIGAALHVRAISFCARNLTDGFIAAHVVSWLTHDMEPGMEHVMVEAGLWERAVGGFMVHDYLDYQPSRKQVEEARQQRAEAGRKGGKSSGISRRETIGFIGEVAPRGTNEASRFGFASSKHEAHDMNTCHVVTPTIENDPRASRSTRRSPKGNSKGKGKGKKPGSFGRL